MGGVQDGKFVYQRGCGSANLDYAIPNSPDMVYYVGSDSKQFTAASVALLSLSGRISLDDDIRKYFPEMGRGGFAITYIQNFDKVGAGGLYTTLDDLRKWDQNFYTKQVGATRCSA